MPDKVAISRRTAALGVAGALAAAARPAVADTLASIASPEHSSMTTSLHHHHRHITALLQTVSRSVGARARTEAFERCKNALRTHDASEAIITASNEIAEQRFDTCTGGLYRHGDPATVLADVLVRELDAWPKTDAGWLERFSDLEAAYDAHVIEHERQSRSLSRRSPSHG